MKTRILILGLLFALLPCGDLYAWDSCDVHIKGPRIVNVGETVSLSAHGSPSGGECSWSNTPGLAPSGCSATFTGSVEGSPWVWVHYSKPPKEFKCHDVARITVGDTCEDRDQDGYQAIGSGCTQGNDCDDGDPAVYPGAIEICDQKDNDCDGQVDEELSTDADGDGHYSIDSCESPNDDCNDSDPSIHPGAEEHCDWIDNDCDGELDPSLCLPESRIGPDTSEGDGPPVSQNSAGEPIDLATGNVYVVENDFSIQADGIPSSLTLAFQRTYNSQSRTSGPLGYGWTHNYNLALVPGDGVMGVRRETGQVVYFREEEDGSFVPLGGVRNRLKRDGELFRLTTVQEITYTFSQAGKIIGLSDLHGTALSFFYQGGDLMTVSDDFGRSIHFEYENGRISKVIDPSGRHFLYTYGGDRGENLSSAGYPSKEGADPLVRSYLYEDPNDPHNITGVIDENGSRFLAFAYDESDRAVSGESAGGAMRIDIDYSGGDSIVLTNSLGKRSVYTREVIGGIPYITRIEEASEEGGRCSSCGPYGSYRYDGDHRLISTADPLGRETLYSYDERGNVLTRTEAAGTNGERTVRYEYHPRFNKPVRVSVESVDAPGKEKITELEYNATGDLIQITERGYSDGHETVRVTRFDVNGRGQITRIDGPRDDVEDVVELTYYPDEASLGESRGRLHTVSDLSGVVECLDYDPFGRPLRIRDRNGVESALSYSSRGRLESVSVEGRITRYEYDAVGNLVGVVDPEGRRTRFRYDGARRLYEVENPAGERIRDGLDPEGNITKREILDRDGSLVFSVSMDYTPQNWLERVRFPGGASELYRYDAGGRLTGLRDEKGRWTEAAYDELDRLQKLTRFIEQNPVQTEYVYDVHGNIAAVTDAEGHTTRYIFDDFQELLVVDSPDAGVTQYRYDPAGNCTEKIDASGLDVHYDYDALNRLTLINYPHDPDTLYFYDAGENAGGRLSGMRDASGVAKFIYDVLGNLVQVEKNIIRAAGDFGAIGNLGREEENLAEVPRNVHGSGNLGRSDENFPRATYHHHAFRNSAAMSKHQSEISYTTRYLYDRSGRLVGLIYPGGRELHYRLDEVGRIARITTKEGGNTTLVADGISYRPFGPLTGIEYANGVTVEKDFDLRYRLKSLYAEEVLDLSYEYDGVRSLKSIFDNLDPRRTQAFSYDDLNRLTGAEGIYGTIEYSYDRVGNRVMRRENGRTDLYVYSPGSNRIAAVTGDNPMDFFHDPTGKITSMGGTALRYGENDRLIGISEERRFLGQFTYNGFGERQIARFLTGFQNGMSGGSTQRSSKKAATARIQHAGSFARHAGFLQPGVWSESASFANLRNLERSSILFNGDHGKRVEEVSWHQERNEKRNGAVAVSKAGELDSDYGLAKAKGIHEEGASNRRAHWKGLKAWRWSGKSRFLEKRARAHEIFQKRLNPPIHYHYDFYGRLIAETDARSGKTIREYLYAGEDPVAMSERKELSFIHTDHLGSPIRMTDATGRSVWRADYKPFGHTLVDPDPDGDHRNLTLNLRFPGQYLDSPTALHYNYHRYYDPNTGRYLTPDPIGQAGGINLYVYSSNNAVAYIDRWGLCASDRFLDATAMVGSGVLQAVRAGWNALGSQDLQRGIEFGFKAAGEITLDVAVTVSIDAASAYVPNSKWFPLTQAGGLAFGRSSTALQATWNFGTAGPKAVDLSSRVQAIQRDVFKIQ